MNVRLKQHVWHIVTTITNCRIETPTGVVINLPAGIQHPHFADTTSFELTGQATVRDDPRFGISSTAVLDGVMESNLNVGHGAAAAVPAECALTPGADLDIGGTLEHDGTVVELEDQFAELDIAVSHPEYGGKLEVTDTGGQTLYTFDVPAEPGDFASIELTLAQGWEMDGIEFALDKGDGDTLELAYTWEGDFVLADFADFLNSGAEGSLGDFAEAQTWGPGIKITLKDPAFAGAAGNAVSYAYRSMSPFTNEDGETFSGGGENARDLAGLVETMQDDDAPVEVEVNADNDGVLLTSKLGGAAGAYNVVNVAGSGDLWLGVDDTLAIATPRTLEDLATAISDDAALMELVSASVSEGRIVLTAPTTPTARQYNGLEYTATGCFGSGTVKQGRTTRGQNAVEQTAFKIYLNGEEFTGGGLPVPTPLTPTTAMQHGGVYTVVVDGTAQDFSAVTIGANARAEIRVASYVKTAVTWPAAWKWMTETGGAPVLGFARNYVIEVRESGGVVLARVVGAYTPGLPAGFTGLDYVTVDRGGSAAAGCIETNITVKQGDVWYNEVENLINTYRGGWGHAYYPDATTSAGLYVVQEDGVNILKAGMGETLEEIGPFEEFVGARHALKITMASSIEVDGTAVISEAVGYTEGYFKRWYVHGVNAGSAGRGLDKSRIYGGYIKRGSETLAKWVPCRRVSDGAYCLYNLVAGEVMTVGNWTLTHE